MNAPNYCWHKQLFSQSESAWSIICKFLIWNQCSMAEFLRSFGRTKRWSTNNEDYMFNKYINFSRLGEAIYGDSTFFVNSCTDQCFNGLSVGISKHLRFCPDCLNLGFHSRLHQFYFLDACQHHSKRIIDNCPKCKRKIPIYDYSSFVRPHMCPNCQYSLSSSTDWGIKLQELYVLHKVYDEYFECNEIGHHHHLDLQ